MSGPAMKEVSNRRECLSEGRNRLRSLGDVRCYRVVALRSRAGLRSGPALWNRYDDRDVDNCLDLIMPEHQAVQRRGEPNSARDRRT